MAEAFVPQVTDYVKVSLIYMIYYNKYLYKYQSC